MAKEHDPNEVEANIEGFFAKYKIGLVLQLGFIGAIMLVNFRIGLALLIFSALAWLILHLIGMLWRITDRAIPKDLAPEKKEAIKQACGATVFLGCFAVIGVVLRTDNAVSTLIRDNTPDTISLTFINPLFALVVLAGVWLYTWFRVKH